MGIMDRSWGTYGKVAIFLFVVGIAASLATYLYYTSYIILYSWNSLPSGIKEVPIPFFEPTKNLLALISVAISVLVVFSVLIYIGRAPFSKVPSQKEQENYSVYATVFIAAMILVSLISSTLFPSNITYESIVLNFSEQIGVVTLTFVLQVVPISIFSVFMAYRSKLGIKDVLLGGKRLGQREAGIVFGASFVFDAIMLYVVNGFSSYAEWIILFAASNVLYLRFGFWRAYLANFIFSSLLVISYAVLFNSVLSITFELFIFVWVLIGFLILTSVGMSSYVRRREEEIRNRKIEEEKAPAPVEHTTGTQIPTPIPEGRMSGKMKLWVQGGCPSCGNLTFNADRQATLTCLKCGREVGINETHPHNITIRNGRLIVTMKRDSNEDLYS